MSKKSNLTVAQYIDAQVALSNKSQVVIAKDIGYEKPNMLTMLKQGKTKLPVNKVPALARSLGIDPVYFMRLVLSEYQPELFEAIEAVYGASLLSPGELSLALQLREATKGTTITDEPEFAEKMVAFAHDLAVAQGKKPAGRSASLKSVSRKAA